MEDRQPERKSVVSAAPSRKGLPRSGPDELNRVTEMGTSSYIYAIGKRTLAAIVCALTLLGCDSVIYDGEGDCSVNYRVKFRYDMNLKFADAIRPRGRVGNALSARRRRQGGLAAHGKRRSPRQRGIRPWRWTSLREPTTCWHGADRRTKVRSGSRNRHPGRS